jgi:capsular polysaccharide biosynthesis protein
MTTAETYRALWRHRFFIVVLTGIMIGVAWYFTSRQTPLYEASTLVRIQQTGTDPGSVVSALIASEQLAQTYAEILETGALRGRLREALDGRPDSEQIAELEIDAAPVESLDLLWINARSPSPSRAAAAANAMPVALRDFIRDTGTVRDKIVTVKPAGLPTDPSSPNLIRNLVIAGLLGLLFNGVLAVLVELLSDRLPDADDLEQVVKKPVLATIPPLSLLAGTPDVLEVSPVANVAQGDGDASRPSVLERSGRG